LQIKSLSKLLKIGKFSTNETKVPDSTHRLHN
jgi:hypothetical protein